MGDVGYLDDRGRLWFCGRKSHRVFTQHGMLFTDMVEPIFNTVPGVFRTALVGVRRNNVTYPVLCVELAKPRSKHLPPPDRDFGEADLEIALRARGGEFDNTRTIGTFLLHSSFPVDIRHNSKIFREKLAVWADKTLGKRWNPTDNTRVTSPSGSGARG
jgi:acyl-CoA synthetase (AMP-forming)/AMP-acid ligase II